MAVYIVVEHVTDCYLKKNIFFFYLIIRVFHSQIQEAWTVSGRNFHALIWTLVTKSRHGWQITFLWLE